MAREKHRFELCGSTYIQIFFSIVNATVLHDLWLAESSDMDMLVPLSLFLL